MDREQQQSNFAKRYKAAKEVKYSRPYTTKTAFLLGFISSVSMCAEAASAEIMSLLITVHLNFDPVVGCWVFNVPNLEMLLTGDFL
jgi:hypothetical protein